MPTAYTEEIRPVDAVKLEFRIDLQTYKSNNGAMKRIEYEAANSPIYLSKFKRASKFPFFFFISAVIGPLLPRIARAASCSAVDHHSHCGELSQ